MRPYIQDQNDFDARVSEGDASKLPYLVVVVATIAASIFAGLSSSTPAVASSVVFGVGISVIHAMNLYWVLKGKPEWVLPLGRRLGRLFVRAGQGIDRTRGIVYAVIGDFIESMVYVAIVAFALVSGFR